MKKGKNLNIWLAMSMFLLLMVSTATGEIIFVDVDATGNNDGTSWTDAYNYLQDALAVALSGDEIWVAEGIYRPDQGIGITLGDRTAAFQLINGVAIRGGYAGFGEPDPNARDVELYETILSGDLDGNDVDVNDPCDLWNEPSRAENCYHVVTGGGTDETAVLDGFTITGGNANGSSYSQKRGGGMYNNSGSPTLTNCTFSGNSAVAGGGMYNKDSNPILTNCTFSGNVADYGGGMSNSGSNARLKNCMFRRNSSQDAGGMANSNYSAPVLSNCIFCKNSAGRGAAMVNGSHSRPTLTNCAFSGNSASWQGGGLMNSYYSSPTLTNCTFVENSAPNGKALSCDSREGADPSYVQLSNCILWDGGDEVWNNDGSAIEISFSDVQGGWAGEGNIDADPCFADANNGDYHLLPDSPCIDSGDPNYVAEPNETDLDGKPRIIGGRIDMGAFEYSPPIPAEVRIVPRTINLASKGKWIRCYIWLGEEYDVADIEPNSVLLEDEVEPEWLSVDEEQQVAIVRFSWSEVQGILAPGEVELVVSGELTDGTVFEGTDVIRVIDKGRRK